jgi:hypothetical protein
MFRRFTKPRLAIGGLVAAGALALAVGAYAFFTSTGTGSGTASVGTAGNNIYVTAVTGGTVYPGGPAQSLTFTAKNFATFSQAISNIHATGVAACSVAWSTPDLSAYPVGAPTCSDSGQAAADDTTCATYSKPTNLSTGTTNNTADEFWIPDTSVSPTGDGNLGASVTTTLNEKGSVAMNDLNVNENACENKYLEFTFTTA